MSIAWSSLLVLEVLFRASDLAPIPLWCWVLEGLVVLGVGLAHATLAPDDWRGSAAWPGAVAVGSSLSVWGWTNLALNFDVAVYLLPLAIVGAAGAGVVLIRALDRPVLRWVPAALLSLAAPLAVQLVVVGPRQTVDPFVPSGSPTTNGPPLIIVSIDTLRADAAQEMQTVQRLRQRGRYWPRAMAGSSWTWPSIVTLWSGVPAAVHHAGRKPVMEALFTRWSDELPWLPAQLRAAGYRTAAFAANPMVALMGLDASFDEWRYGHVVRMPLWLTGFPADDLDGGDARHLVDAAIDWLADAPERGWLLWVHLYEPHLPYRHGGHRTGWDYNLLRHVRVGDWFSLPEVREDVKRGYREDVAHADRELGRLLDALEARDFFDDGVLVLTSDHGEELWDHDGFEHGHSHHGEVVDVPLVVVAPGLESGEGAGLAALEDVANTLRAVAGLPLPEKGIDLRAPIPVDRVARADGNFYGRPMHSFRAGRSRVIVDGDRITLYDLDRDPEERSPVSIGPTELRAIVGGAADDHPPPELDEQALRALGYVH